MARKIVIGLHLFIGLGAMGGGLAAILNPKAPMGISVTTLNGVFNDFLIPGLFLFIVIGIGNLIGYFLVKKQKIMANYYSFFIGLVLMLWIIIQCLILNDIVTLHIIFFILGFVQLVCSTLLIKEDNSFPF